MYFIFAVDKTAEVELKVEALKAAIKKTNGKPFKVRYVKRSAVGPSEVMILEGSIGRKAGIVIRDNEDMAKVIRVMEAKTGVKKDIKGKGLMYNPDEHNLAVVWDIKKKAYRTISLEGVISFECGDIKLEDMPIPYVIYNLTTKENVCLKDII